MARIAVADNPPLTAATLANVDYVDHSKSRAAELQRRPTKIQHLRKQPDVPSAHEIFNTAQSIRTAEWEGAERQEGFTVRDSNDPVQNMRAVATHQDSGKSL